MKRIIWVLALVLAIVIALIFLLKNIKEQNQARENQLRLNELRGVAKLVIWEQDFSLKNTESVSRRYFGIVKTKESVHTTVDGTIGFHINLADSVHTQIKIEQDSIFIIAKLENSYIDLDLSSIHQHKESSLDPTLEIKKEEVIKDLKQKVIDEYLPNLEQYLSDKDLRYQEEKLSAIAGKPVRIKISEWPKTSEIKWIDSL